MDILLTLIGCYIIYAGLQIMYFKYKEAKFQKSKIQKDYSDYSAKAQ